MRTIPPHDVIIAGAGPVGLMLACELRLARCSVLVLEQATSPDSPLKQPPFGVRGLSIPTLEALHRRGLLDAVVGTAGSGDTAAMGAAASATWRPFRGHPVLPRQDRHRALALAPAGPVQREPAQHHGPH